MSVTVFPPAIGKVPVAGKSVIAIYLTEKGSRVTNPAIASTPLYVNINGPASTSETGTTFALAPGDSFETVDGVSTTIWVNATNNNHLFSAYFIADSIQYPPSDLESGFPPNGLTTQQNLIPSYLYQQYSDDDDMQSFVYSYNLLAQQYIDTLNSLNLPIYTADNIAGPLLDWVAQGLYGMSRPSLSTGLISLIGPFNTYQLNTLAFNQIKITNNQNLTITSDDIFKRILTWHFYKGDGDTFNIRWLKRRIMRFINGINGTAPNVDNTYQVSISFGVGYQVNITLVSRFTKIVGGAIFGSGFQGNTYGFNQIKTHTTNIAPLDSQYLIEGIKTGVLELPFQFTYVVTAG